MRTLDGEPARSSHETGSAGRDSSLVEPFWESTVMHKESLCFIEEEDAEASARLLFPPEAVLGLTSASGEVVFEEGRDYVVCGPQRLEKSRNEVGKAGCVVRLPGSRLPVTKRQDLSNFWNCKRDEFHTRQAAITYAHAPRLWCGCVPHFA